MSKNWENNQKSGVCRRLRCAVLWLTVFLFFVTGVPVPALQQTVQAGEFDSAREFYEANGYNGKYNINDNCLYFGTNDTLYEVYARYETVGKRIYFKDPESEYYIDLARWGGAMQELNTVLDGSQEYLLYRISYDVVLDMFTAKYGYLQELMEPEWEAVFYVDDIMTVKLDGNRIGDVSDNGDGTVSVEGDVAFTAPQMMKLWYRETGIRRDDWRQYYDQLISFIPRRPLSPTKQDNYDTEGWTNYAHYIYPDPEGIDDIDHWDSDSFWAEEEGVTVHTFTAYKAVWDWQDMGDGVCDCTGACSCEGGSDCCTHGCNCGSDMQYVVTGYEVAGTSTIVAKIDYHAPVIHNVNDTYGWLNYTIMVNPAAYDRAPEDNPHIPFSTLKSLCVVGGEGLEGVTYLYNDGKIVHNNMASLVLMYRNEGVHTVTFRAEDWAGNITEKDIEVLQDFTPPEWEDYAYSEAKLLDERLINGMYHVRTESDSFGFKFRDQDWLSGIDYAVLKDDHGDEKDHDTGEPAILEFTLRPWDMVNSEQNESMYYDYFVLTAYDRAGNSTSLRVQPRTLFNMHWYRKDAIENDYR